MTPHLVRWHEELAAEGLVVIEVDNGMMDPLSEVREYVTNEQIPFMVLHDGNGGTSDAYEVWAYPTAFLIDRAGKVCWAGHPSPEEAETLIRQTLRKREE